MKKINLTLTDFFNLPSAEIYNADKFKPVSKVSIDSRSTLKNSLFIAIKGDKFDGHSFIRQAIEKGASIVIINKNNYKKFRDVKIPLVTVSNTSEALGDLAKIWRKKLNAIVIGISGSNGKTSTKEMLAALLTQKYSVNKTFKNNNNHIGVPLTILSSNEKHEIVIIELGTNHFGEIQYTASIAQPDYAVITNIGESHLEFLKNKRGVLTEKAALFNETIKAGGTISVNIDDKYLTEYSKKYKKKITYSLKKYNADVSGKITSVSLEGHPQLTVKFKNKSMHFELPLYGMNSAKNFIAALSIGLNLGLKKNQITSGLKQITPVDKRLNVIKNKNFIVVDDTYNANPESMKSAFNLVRSINLYKKKILVLGDMFELGKDSVRLHEELAKEIFKNKISSVYTIGSLMNNLNKVLKSQKIESKHFRNRESLKSFLSHFDFAGSVVLVKGSRGMRMEEFEQIIEKKAND